MAQGVVEAQAAERAVAVVGMETAVVVVARWEMVVDGVVLQFQFIFLI